MAAGWDTRYIGPCEVTYDGEVLGNTEGGCEFSSKYDTATTTVDKTGTTARAKIITGVKVEVTCNLAELTLADLAKIIPGANSGTDSMYVKNSVGTDLVAAAATLILKPIVDGVAATDESEWLTVPAASCAPDLAIPFQLDKQRVYKVTFEGHPTTVGAATEVLWYIGEAPAAGP